MIGPPEKTRDSTSQRTNDDRKRGLGPTAFGTVGVIITLAAIGFGRTIGTSILVKTDADTSDAQLTQLTAKAAADLAKQVPIKLDENTTMISVVSVGKGIIYSDRINVDKSTINVDNGRPILISNIMSYACKNMIIKQITSLGGYYKYIYTDVNGSYILDITIDENAMKTCK